MIVSETAVDVHSQLRHPALVGWLRPDRARWTAVDLRELVATLTAELNEPLRNVVRYDRDQRWWTRLALTAGVEVWLLSWLPHQRTAPHDHGGAAGAFAVVLGTLTERYRYSGSSVGIRRHTAGEAVSLGPTVVHEIENLGTEPAASVHAYSPPLLPTRDYASLHRARPAIPSLRSGAVNTTLAPGTTR